MVIDDRGGTVLRSGLGKVQKSLHVSSVLRRDGGGAEHDVSIWMTTRCCDEAGEDLFRVSDYNNIPYYGGRTEYTARE